MNRPRTLYSAHEAAQESPTLAALIARAQDANARLQAICGLIPQELQAAVSAGPAEGEIWCLLVRGNAAAAKLRQLTPRLLAHLRSRGWQVSTLRIKVQVGR